MITLHVVPANAGTHNHKRLSPGVEFPQAADLSRRSRDGGYGPRRSPGRRRLQTLFAVAAAPPWRYVIANKTEARRKHHGNRFRNPLRGQGDPRKGAAMGA